MITRLEATRYRCFERLGIDVGDFRVLVGANGSGKTTLLDLPVLLGDLLRANNVAIPFMERRQELPPRAGGLNENGKRPFSLLYERWHKKDGTLDGGGHETGGRQGASVCVQEESMLRKRGHSGLRFVQ